MSEAVEGLLAKARRHYNRAVKVLAEGDEDLDIVVSRAYYAMFYVAEALLAAQGLHYSSHWAVIGAYGQQFAKTRRLDPRFHRWLMDAYELRAKADYSIEPLPTEAHDVLVWARDFLAAATAFLGLPDQPLA